jgi:DNA-binding transcriptional ArsR family regulator
VSGEGISAAAELRAALVEAMGEPLRARILIFVADRPGATLAQLAARTGEPEGRIRDQLELLIEAGLVKAETPPDRPRERNHRVVAMPTIFDADQEWSDEARRKVALSIVKQVVADVGQAIHLPDFGARDGNSTVRVPGEVDERGWHELARIAIRHTGLVEETMVASAGRLEAAGESGIEVISALLFFEGVGWEPVEGDRSGPRPSQWLTRAIEPGDGGTAELEADVGTLPPHLEAALVEALGDPLRAQVYDSIAERPGATIAQVAARLDEPDRRVRRQVDRLTEAGLLVVWAETPRRNARQRHYRTVAIPRIEESGSQSVEQRSRITRSLIQHVVADIGRAIRRQTFGERAGHSEVRIPGEVDERGWEELAQLMTATTVSLEETLIASAARLEAAGRAGIEVVAALLLFETQPWERGDGDPRGPRPSQWLVRSREGSPAEV